jgi:hypothetical protein
MGSSIEGMSLKSLVPLLLLASLAAPSSGQVVSTKTYALATWNNDTCGAKGRFQDSFYCSSPVIDRIVTDGKSAIPVLISQITDSRFIEKPVYHYWPRIRAGELAHFILSDLFLDETWTKRTIPDLFPQESCNEPGWVCWGNFRKTHSLNQIQTRWMEFWKANRERIYLDNKARCFRLSDAKTDSKR